MIAKFNNLNLALNFSNTINKANAVILGDDDMFWVVTLAKMEELITAGYQVVK